MVVLCTEEGAFNQYIANRISREKVPCIKLSTQIINRPCIVVVQSVRAKQLSAIKLLLVIYKFQL